MRLFCIAATTVRTLRNPKKLLKTNTMVSQIKYFNKYHSVYNYFHLRVILLLQRNCFDSRMEMWKIVPVIGMIGTSGRMRVEAMMRSPTEINVTNSNSLITHGTWRNLFCVILHLYFLFLSKTLTKILF